MRVLVVGAGGREHALTWMCARSGRVSTLLAAPGNAGIAEQAEIVPIGATDAEALAQAVRQHQVDLVIIGPDAALEAGVADACEAAGTLVFGPTKAAARIESSKLFAKRLMDQAGTSTARWRAGDAAGLQELIEFARARDGRVAVKADGLALGKGVAICDSMDAVQAALAACFTERKHGAAGDVVIVEELLAGREVSVFAICDGTRAWLLPPARDYKRAFDGDLGPNTGGMGSCSPPAGADVDELLDSVAANIITPTLTALRELGTPFRGCLYAGLMLTDQGPQVIEFNARFGDPETQVLLPMVDSTQLFDLMAAAAAGDLGTDGRIPAARPAGVTVIAAGQDYPASGSHGAAIELPAEQPENTVIFHAGTARDADGVLRTNGGRVLAVSATGADLATARTAAYDLLGQVRFDGLRFRHDIAT